VAGPGIGQGRSVPAAANPAAAGLAAVPTVDFQQRRDAERLPLAGAVASAAKRRRPTLIKLGRRGGAFASICPDS